MKVIICGAGQVGWQIARHLASENNDVVVVDNNPDLVRRATDSLDVQGVAGFASYPDVLERAGAGNADMIIAATQSDEVNMVTCQVAHSVFKVARKVARLRARGYLEAHRADIYRRDHLPIDVVISPEREVASAALQRLSVPAAFDTEEFMDGNAQLLGITIEEGCPVVNTSLRQLTELFSTLRGVVVGIRREGRLFSPESSDQLFVGDSAYLFVPAGEARRMLEVFGKANPEQERLVILGAGNVGLEVAQALERSAGRGRAKVIERDRARAELAAEALERTIVLHGDGLDRALLSEAGIERADAMLAITDDDKTNILAAVRSKAEGCRMAIALINDPTLVPLTGLLGIDAYINPRATTVSSILRHVRRGRVRAVYSIGDAEAEVLEAEVIAESPLAGRKLADVGFPEGARLGSVLRDGECLRPSGEFRLEAGDVVAIFAMASSVAEIGRLLQVEVDLD